MLKNREWDKSFIGFEAKVFEAIIAVPYVAIGNGVNAKFTFYLDDQFNAEYIISSNEDPIKVNIPIENIKKNYSKS